MKRKVFSGLDRLPRGKASENLVEGCLVLEGGAFRGVYTSGVLDLLMEKGINLTTTVGVSAGALNGFNYVSGDIGRSALCNLKHRHDDRWVGAKAVRNNHGIMGFDFLNDGLEKEYPLDRNRLMDPSHRLVTVVTNLETGKAEYFDSREIDFDTLFTSVEASASMPFVSKPVRIGSGRYLDGGCSIKIPIRWALERDFSKIVVVTTREPSFRREEKTKESRMTRMTYRACPEFRKALTETDTVYNRDCDEIDRLVEEGRIFRIAPSEKVGIKRLEGDMEKLGALYWLGYRDAERACDALADYLKR